MHSLCGIIGSCRHLLSLTLFLPADSAAWTQSLCNSFNDVGDSPGLAELIPLLTLRAALQLKNLQTLTKDLEPSSSAPHCGGAGRHEGMDVGWRPKRDMSMWAVSQVSICHLHSAFTAVALILTLPDIVRQTSRNTQESPYSSIMRNLERFLNFTSSSRTFLEIDRSHPHRSQVSTSSLSHRCLFIVLNAC